MEFGIVGLILCQILLAHYAHSKSIDEIFAEVEEERFVLSDGRDAQEAWYKYTMENRTEQFVKLQYDMIITKERWLDIINTTAELPVKRRKKRNAVKEKEYLWSRRISYTIMEGFSIEEKYLLLQAMNHWEEYTCLKFVEARETDRDVIVFVPNTGKCESIVGRMEGRQAINLAERCMTKRILLHEIGHALGFYHEQNRADRDLYVTVNYKNIKDGKERQFDPLNVGDYDDYDKAYDFFSVMHYGNLTFSKNKTAGLTTMVPKDVKYRDVIGQSPSLSYYDIKIANDLYKCSDGCPQEQCRDGFIGGSNCECFCQYDDVFDVRICGAKAVCPLPKVDFEVYDLRNWNYDAVNLSVGTTFPHGFQFRIFNKQEGCEDIDTSYTCNDGTWEGVLPLCQGNKGCIVNYDTEKYTMTYSGNVAKNGDEIECFEQVEVTCRYNTPGIQAISLVCLNGQWDPAIDTIGCKTPKPCQMVANATLTGSFENGYRVVCINRYSVATSTELPERFTCNLSGKWQPFDPVCKPNNCTAPTITGSLKDSKGVKINTGDLVVHGSDVTLTCPSGHVPDPTSYTCDSGVYNTPDGKIPDCKPVFCGKPQVTGTRYRPRKPTYMYGDSVSVRLCAGQRELVGSHRLQCTKDGSWSDTAACSPYCKNGIDTFKIQDGYIFSKLAGWSTKAEATKFETCKEACQQYKKYLCRGIVFGYDTNHYQCSMYISAPHRLQENLQQVKFWTSAIRTCITN